MNGISRIRRGALLGGSALVLAMAGSSSAMAQCTGGPTIVVPGIGLIDLTPFAAGAAASVNSAVSVLNTVGTAYLTQTNAFIGAPANPQPNQPGGGVWVRGIGGRVDTDAVGVVTVDGFPGDPITCNTTTRQEFWGVQAGADLARLNVGGWNLHGGLTAGYAESKATDESPGGSFSGTFQVPFLGLYGAATYGGFFVDAQLRFDFYQNQLRDPSNGVLDQALDARGVSFSGNIGYFHGFGDGYFIEPSAGIVHSRVSVDPFQSSGTLVTLTGLAPPGTITIDDIESTLGRLSIRAGKTFVSGNVALQPFVTASLFHEFAGDVTTRFDSCFGALVNLACGGLGAELGATLSTSRIGTYGQFALGIAGQLVDTGWLGYARVDYRTGENVEGISLNGGLRYQFTPGPVAAPVLKGKGPVYKAPPAPVLLAYNWTGFYVGGHVGVTWGETDWLYTQFNTRTDPRFAGILGGGQIGFNYQTGNWVLGVEIDASATNARGGKACPNGFFFSCEVYADWLAMATGRVGYAWDRTLWYAKGGVAWGEVTVQERFNPLALISADTQSGTGFAIGTGFEFGLTQNWSAKAEYMYYDLGADTYIVNAQTVDVDRTGSRAIVGVNYRFPGIPLAR